MKRPSSLQGRLQVLVLAGVLLLWGTALLYTAREASHEIDELLDSHLAQSAALLLAQGWRADGGRRHGHGDGHGDGHDDDHEHGVETPLLHRYAPRSAFQVWHEGQLALRSANAPREPMATHRQGFQTVDLAGTAWRVFAARGAEDDIQVYVAEQFGSRASILHAVMRGLLLPMGVALPLLALAVWWAVRRGLQPLQRLRQALAAREPQALAPLSLDTLDGATTELGPLVAELNRLFERIGTLLAAERRFTADAAHELRTPIAAIRAQAQVALGAAADNAARTRALQSTLAGCDRAVHLVEQLLTLARLESQAAPPTAPVDLVALARQVIADGAAPALAKHQALELVAPQPVVRPGHEALLAVLLRNLLDNAVRYSPPGAPVRVTVEPGCLRVEDGGPGVPAAERARLGERFFRVLGSGESGSGLGLSIVQRIASAHGAQLAIDASPDLGGLRVQLQWPAVLPRPL